MESPTLFCACSLHILARDTLNLHLTGSEPSLLLGKALLPESQAWGELSQVQTRQKCMRTGFHIYIFV